MKKFSKFLIPFFIFVIILNLIPFSVNAQSYYNWLESPSFSGYSNWCEDGGFESGVFNSGEVYGNWSIYAGVPSFESNPTYIQSGVYSIKCENNEFLWFNFTDGYQPYGSDIVSLSISWYQPASSSEPIFKPFYSDGTTGSQYYFDYLGEDAYYTADFKSNITDGKILVAFWLGTQTYTTYFDDVTISIDDGSAQTEITEDSTPWYLGGSYLYGFGAINDVYGRTDTNSVVLSGSTTYKLYQSLDYLYASEVHYIDMYVMGDGSNETGSIGCYVLYADRTSDSKEVEYSSETGWNYINFGSLWLDDTKLIIAVAFYVAEFPTYAGGTLLCDDFGVWVTESSAYSRFSYSVSPSPIGYNSYTFSGYYGVQYTITGYVYNATGFLVNDGIYQITHSLGSSSGVINEGVFNITLASRSGSANGQAELIGFIFTMNNSEVIAVTLTVYWYSGSGDIDSGIDVDINTAQLNDWFMYAIFLVVIPLGMTIYVGGSNEKFQNPLLMLITFLGMETLMSTISLAIGLVNVWFMLVIIIVDVLIILGLMRAR